MMVVFVMIMIMIYDDNLTSHIAPNKFKMPVRAMYTLTYPVTSVNENIELFLILHCQSEPYPCSCNNCAFNSQSYPRLCCVLPKYSRCLLFESLDTSLHYLSFQSEPWHSCSFVCPSNHSFQHSCCPIYSSNYIATYQKWSTTQFIWLWWSQYIMV